MLSRVSTHARSLAERVIRVIPLAGGLLVLSYYTAKQVVTPHHRMVKTTVLAAILMFMFRFDIIYSLFMYTILFPFPSGISVGSTNSILMTLIGLTWAIRATSTGQPIHERTRYDWAIALLLMAYLLSFYNTESNLAVVRGLNSYWRQIAAIIYFFLIIRFVTDEKRLMRFTKVFAFVVGVIVLTGLAELFMPGTTLIPGWIGVPDIRGRGTLGFRVQGVRLGGAVGGHNILSDFAMLGSFLMAFHVLKSRNPLERFIWLLTLIGAFAVMLGTGNRGAALSTGFGLLYGLYHFRKRMSFPQLVFSVATVVAGIIVIQGILYQYTYTTNVFDRLKHTEFKGIEPDTREGIWQHTFERSLEHPIIGHGPWYNTGRGLTFQYWPHNAYLFYLYTIGLLGLGAFLWISWLVVRRSMIHRHPTVWGTKLGDMTMLLHVEVVTLLFSMLRTDHQRDEVHIHLVWLIFGLAAAASEVSARRIREAQTARDASEGDGAGSGASALTGGGAN